MGLLATCLALASTLPTFVAGLPGSPQPLTSGTRLSRLSISPNKIPAGAITRGRVEVATAAPKGGASVLLASSRRDVRVPAFVVVAEGKKFADFVIRTSVDSPAGPVRVAALRGRDTRVADLLITRPAPIGS